MEQARWIPGAMMEGILILMSVPDIKKKKIAVWMLALTAVPVVVCIIIGLMYKATPRMLIIQTLLGAVPGCAMILLSRVTGKVGIADGLVLIAIGMMEGIRGALVVLCLGSVYLAIPALILLAMKKVKKETCLPFIPFMALGFLVWRIMVEQGKGLFGGIFYG